MKGEETQMRTQETGAADIRLAEAIANQGRQYREHEDPELNYMVHFSSADWINQRYEA